MSQILYKWIFLVSIELIHYTKHVQLIFLFFYWPEFWKLTKCVSFWAQKSLMFLAPETDIMGQFLGPETDILGERYFMDYYCLQYHKLAYRLVGSVNCFITASSNNKYVQLYIPFSTDLQFYKFLYLQIYMITT